MSERPFVHLHCHTDYSLLDGACDIKKLMQRGQAAGHALRRDDRPWQPFRRRRVLQRSEQRGSPSGHRLRSLRFAAGPQDPLRPGSLQPPGPAVLKPGRLQEPHQPGLDRLSGWLLLQAARRQRPAGAPFKRTDRDCRPACAATSTRRFWPTDMTKPSRSRTNTSTCSGRTTSFSRLQDHGLDQDKHRHAARSSGCRPTPAFRWS